MLDNGIITVTKQAQSVDITSDSAKKAASGAPGTVSELLEQLYPSGTMTLSREEFLDAVTAELLGYFSGYPDSPKLSEGEATQVARDAWRRAFSRKDAKRISDS